MQNSDTVVVDGKPVGKTEAGWLLFKETRRFIKQEPALIWVPILVASIVFPLIAYVMYLFTIKFSLIFESDVLGLYDYTMIFACYLVGAFGTAVIESVVAIKVCARVRGEDVSFSDAWGRTFSRSAALFGWSAITSTVGVLIIFLSRKVQLVGKIVFWLMGAAWSILTYFSVPSIIIAGNTPVVAIKDSARVFKATWGETLVSNISYRVAFTAYYILALVLPVIAMLVWVAFEIFVLERYIASYTVSEWFWLPLLLIIPLVLLVGFIELTFAAVLKTLLYMYATEKMIPADFNTDLLVNMLQRQTTIESQN